MMNSILKKVLVLALSFSLGSLVCISLIIGFLLEKQIYDRTEKTLETNALSLHEDVKRFLEGEISKEQIKQSILSLKENDNIQVSIMTEERKPLFTYENKEVQHWIDEVLKQKAEMAEMTFHKNKEINMFIVGVPILFHHENKGAIFLYTPMQEAKELIFDINKIIALSVLILIGPIIFISWLFSKKMVSPILSIRDTVKNISKGDFNKRVTINGKDELMDLGESVNSMAGQLAIIEQSRRRFIGEISHELRTPLTTIRSTLQGIADDVFDPNEKTEFIQLSIGEIKRISDLIDDLTELSALEEKAVVLHKAQTSITDVLESCMRQLSLEAKEKDIIFVKNIEEGTFANIDIDRMKQVIINLLDNAIKHSYRNSVVQVLLAKKEGYIRMEIENSGEEISSEILPYLFDRFYKTDGSRSKKGNGLGLTIAKKIVELHHGEIFIQSNEGRIVFIVNLPLEKEWG